MTFLRFLLHHWFWGLTLFAAGEVPNLGGGGGDGGAGTGVDAGGGAPSGSSQGTSSDQPAPGGQQGGQDNIRQLREAYEGVKKSFEPFQKLNVKPEQVTQYQGVYTKVFEQARQLGSNLGYPDDEIQEALAADPIGTIQFLQQQAQQGQGNEEGNDELSEMVQRGIDARMGPIEQRENVRITNEANQLFERTVYGMAQQMFKAEGIDAAQIPQDEMYLLTSATSEILKYDEKALAELKYQGKTGAIQEAFKQAKTLLDKYYLARQGRDRARVQRPGGQSQNVGQNGGNNGNAKRPTLDEMIENPAVINAKYV